MSIEDLIATGIKPANIITPFQLQYGQDELNQNRLLNIARQRAIEKNDRLREQEGLVNRLYSENYNNPEQFRRSAAQAGVGSIIPEYDQYQREIAKEDRLKVGADLDNMVKQGEAIARAVRGATPENWEKTVTEIEQGIGKPIPKLHFAWDPQKIQAVLEEGMSNTDAIRVQADKYKQTQDERQFKYLEQKDAKQMDIELKKAGDQEKWNNLNYDQRDRQISATAINKPAASEDERKAAGWLSQADNAYKNLISVTEKYKGADSPGALESVSPDGVKGAFQGTGRQLFEQAASSLSESLLRAATGAGVNVDEARQKIKEITPSYFDSDELKKQKRDSIPVYLESLKARAGRAAPEDYQIPQAKEDGMGVGSTGAGNNNSDDPFFGFTPEEKALYLNQYGRR